MKNSRVYALTRPNFAVGAKPWSRLRTRLPSAPDCRQLLRAPIVARRARVAAGPRPTGRRLIHAAKAGNAAKVRALLAGGADVRAQDKDGRTALHWAGCGGHPAVIAALLAGGADINAENRWGETALHLAGFYGHAAAVAMLLAGGGDGKVRNDRGETPRDLAAGLGREAVVQLLDNAAAEARRGAAPRRRPPRKHGLRVSRRASREGAGRGGPMPALRSTRGFPDFSGSRRATQ